MVRGLLGVAPVVGLALTPLFASTVDLLGPVEVVRSTGKPAPVAFTFHSGDPSAPHVLRIDNEGVAAAVVWLNGTRILGPDPFNAVVDVIERPIQPRAENTLVVELRGKPGAGLSLRVSAVDDDPPVISDLLPADGTVVSTPEVTVTARVEDLLSGVHAVTCDGIPATALGDDYACTVPLAEGPNDVEIVATDGCGNSSDASLRVVYDPPPVVEITAPRDGDVLFASPVEVTGTVDDPSATVTVNRVPAHGTAPFMASVPVPNGEQTLTARARDPIGGEGTDSVTVTVLTPGLGPTVSIGSPADGFVVGGPRTSDFPPAEQRVTGRIRVNTPFDDANRPDVTVNGTPALVSRSFSPGPLCHTPLAICWWDFRADGISLPEGDATITALGVDAVGRSDTAQVSGIVEVCLDGDSDGPARVGIGQSNRCHFIDGCSTPDFVAPDVQDPTMGSLGHGSTAFGKDTDVPPEPERFPHGADPRDPLPCNLHDVCYQTCGAVKSECDAQMYDRMVEVCREAYPESICPYTVQGPFGGTILDPIRCPQWRDEKSRCYGWARKYRAGLASPPAFDRFDDRQSEYCLSPSQTGRSGRTGTRATPRASPRQR